MDRRLRIKKNIKIKLRNLFILLIFFIYPSLTADKLKWKDGTTSIGKAINVTGTHVEWQERGRVKKISLSEIDGIEVGYDGVSVCAEFLPNSQINCDLILHKLTKTSASFTTKDSPLKLDVVKLAKINKLEINFTEKEDYSLFIDSGISGFFETTSFKGNGYLVSNQNKIWEIRPDDKKLPIQKINDGELLRFELVKKAAISEFINSCADNAPLYGTEGSVEYTPEFFYIYSTGQWRRVSMSEVNLGVGTEGEIMYDAKFLYIYIGGSWRQLALSNFQ